MVRDVMKCFLCRAVLAVCVACLAVGCGRRDAVGEAFSVGDFFEDGAAGIKPAGVTRRPADGGGDDVTLFWCWISGYVSTEGVEEDIRAFAREGFKRIVISELLLPGLCGPVRNDPMSEGWWEALRAALAAAAESARHGTTRRVRVRGAMLPAVRPRVAPRLRSAISMPTSGRYCNRCPQPNGRRCVSSLRGICLRRRAAR